RGDLFRLLGARRRAGDSIAMRSAAERGGSGAEIRPRSRWIRPPRAKRLWSERSRSDAARGDEPWIGKSGLTVEKRAAVRGNDGATRREQHGVPRRGIPFHRPPEARIQIRLAACEQAEFKRRANRHPICDLVSLKVIARLGARGRTGSDRRQPPG